MAVTNRELLHTTQGGYTSTSALPHRLMPLSYIVTLLLAIIAVYILVGTVVNWGQVRLDDMRYGWPRTTQIDGMVGHEHGTGQPSHFIALNLNRQVVVLELAGGDPNAIRSLPGPYLFGADEDLTPVILALQDMDGDGRPDLLLNVRREQIVYLNQGDSFRLPTAEEQRQLLGAQ